MTISQNTLEIYLDEMYSVYTSSCPSRCDETTPSSLHDHRVWPTDGRRCLSSKSIIGFTEKLFHKVNTFVRDARSGRESQRLSPVQNFLTGDMTLRYRETRQPGQRYHRSRCGDQSIHTELLTKGGNLPRTVCECE